MARPKTVTAEAAAPAAAPAPIVAELVPKETAPVPFAYSEPGQQSDPHRSVQLAIERGQGAETIERLIAAAERWDALQELKRARAAEAAYVRAVIAFKENPPRIKKRSEVDFQPAGKPRVNYRYANLDDVTSLVIPELAKVKLSHQFVMKQERAPKFEETLITITCILRHVDGHFQTAELFGYPDMSGSKNFNQGTASTVSYLERYTLLGILGLSTGDDDDNGGAAGAKQEVSEADQRKLDGFLAKLDEASFIDQLRDVRKEAINAYGTSNKLPPAFASKYEGLRTEFERKARGEG